MLDGIIKTAFNPKVKILLINIFIAITIFIGYPNELITIHFVPAYDWERISITIIAITVKKGIQHITYITYKLRAIHITMMFSVIDFTDSRIIHFDVIITPILILICYVHSIIKSIRYIAACNNTYISIFAKICEDQYHPIISI